MYMEQLVHKRMAWATNALPRFRFHQLVDVHALITRFKWMFDALRLSMAVLVHVVTIWALNAGSWRILDVKRNVLALCASDVRDALCLSMLFGRLVCVSWACVASSLCHKGIHRHDLANFTERLINARLFPVASCVLVLIVWAARTHTARAFAVCRYKLASSTCRLLEACVSVVRPRAVTCSVRVLSAINIVASVAYKLIRCVRAFA
jgi:hypothetical protein